MTVRDNVAFGLKIRKRPKAEIDARVDELLGLVGLARLPGALPVAALRRPAPAHGARPRAGRRAARAAARRAVRRAGRQRARRAARLAAAPARRGPRDDRPRHPRPGGGDGGRRPHRGHGRRAHRAGRRAARALRAAGERVRHGLPRARSRSSATQLVRPHDLALTARGRAPAPSRRRSSASCTSASRCASSSCSTTATRRCAQITRGEAEELELAAGDIVWVAPGRAAAAWPPTRAQRVTPGLRVVARAGRPRRAACRRRGRRA